ncbi:MAG: MerC domain-containing protein [Lysobacteraceae bacterium]|nr:MAG: MerC domain-containing protein [Xanthomonadaceae bacterium]
MPDAIASLNRADRAGFAASFLCAIHCALWPWLLAVAPAFGLELGGWVDLDQAFVVFATVLGISTLTLGWRRHRAFHAWLLLAPGLILVWVGAFTPLHDNHTLGHATAMTIGGALLALAHLVNLRLTHSFRAARNDAA